MAERKIDFYGFEKSPKISKEWVCHVTSKMSAYEWYCWKFYLMLFIPLTGFLQCSFFIVVADLLKHINIVCYTIQTCYMKWEQCNIETPTLQAKLSVSLFSFRRPLQRNYELEHQRKSLASEPAPSHPLQSISVSWKH